MKKEDKLCGLCGKPFKGKNYTVYDENFNKENIERCKQCFVESLPILAS